MPELRLQRTTGTLTITFEEHSTSIPLERVLPTPNLWQHIYEDAASYGRHLFEQTLE